MAENNIYIDDSAQVIDSRLSENSKVYKSCFVKDCVLNSNSIVGDFTRMERSTLGNNVTLQRNAMIYDSVIGKHSYTGKNFTAWHCQIGSFCSISWNVSIGGANHDYTRVTTHSMVYADVYGFLNGADPAYNRFDEECIIGNDVWIGCHAVITRGVRIGNGAVIGASAVVTKDVEPYAVVVGVPAKKISMRFDCEYAERLNKTEWWNLPDDVIRNNISVFGSAVDEKVILQIEELCDKYRDI
jgi:Acetyltransferase (isoleucine patch superfamily)